MTAATSCCIPNPTAQQHQTATAGAPHRALQWGRSLECREDARRSDRAGAACAERVQATTGLLGVKFESLADLHEVHDMLSNRVEAHRARHRFGPAVAASASNQGCGTVAESPPPPLSPPVLRLRRRRFLTPPPSACLPSFFSCFPSTDFGRDLCLPPWP